MKQPIAETIFAGFLSHQIDEVFKIYEKSVNEWDGAFFPYLWMADIAKAVSQGAIGFRDRNFLLGILEKEIVGTREAVRNFIAVSFVENLPNPDNKGEEIVKDYGNLHAEYRKIFGC
jgi:hypothetical protein